ncbi:MAG: YHYH protein [Deltaproteobacteria bacterium]|nr:YHYH protein [Deltaproteobacteria bacterium]
MKTYELALSTIAVGTLLLMGCSSDDPEATDTNSGATGTTNGTAGTTNGAETTNGTAGTTNSETGAVTTAADETGTTGTSGGAEGLHPALGEFDVDNTEIYLDGEDIVLETNGFPNHTSPYWGEGHELYVEPQEGWAENATPSLIPGHDGSFTLRVPVTPQLAAQPTATPLDVIGLSVSGAAIFNEQEGMGVLSEGVAAGLDYSGGHIGPGRYHYHTEPIAITNDDSNLLGILTDGFFIYGRQCASTEGYPADLDEAGGHTSTTQHTDTPEYHYHIENILFLDNYYVIFDGDFQGTPGSVQ